MLILRIQIGNNDTFITANKLTLKAPSKICSRQHLIFFYLLLFIFRENKLDISCESSASLADDSQEISRLHSRKKKYVKLFFTAAVTGALKVYEVISFTLSGFFFFSAALTSIYIP